MQSRVSSHPKKVSISLFDKSLELMTNLGYYTRLAKNQNKKQSLARFEIVANLIKALFALKPIN
ncbi:hypothetical protein BpHYR1_038196 [Brachionus plicatilis]|uniref:Uncharacterized protein n=1 Tax=Brachionus plicatilis TaxID=10195 RepID=A0A3M7T9W1_BRAPC|nr:hypothetical protein BpHYR1_038196 [Brachionus plicatilis]